MFIYINAMYTCNILNKYKWFEYLPFKFKGIKSEQKKVKKNG